MDNPILITVVILALIAILFLMARINTLKIPASKKEKIFKRLEELKIQIEENDGYARRDAIIKLDNLLSQALQSRYRNSNSCGDNLKIAKNLFRKDKYQEIWDVHKIRNEIVHKDKEIGYDTVLHAYKVYKMAISKILS
ncbi:MAG: hypothetical protein ACOX0X_00010 [Candidatus Dojkabacteria bacterium]